MVDEIRYTPRARLEATIEQISASKNVKELVIPGDLIDEWFIPATVDTYRGKDQAMNQYFMNPNSDKRIVVFGHTHVPRIIASSNTAGQETIYANSGTWIDHNNNLTKIDEASIRL